MKKKAIITDTALANSYIDNFFFYSKPSDIIINTSIDLVVLSIEYAEFKALDDELRKYYKVRKDHWANDGNYKRRRVYENNTGTVALLYQPKKPYIPSFLIRLRQPTKEIMIKLSFIFMNIGVSPLVSEIELSFDFYFTNKLLLKELLEQHLFLKHQRNSSKIYKDSYYTNDIRVSVKGIRVYPKPKDSDRIHFVRLELVIGRRKIRELGITFPIQAQHLDLDFGKFFEFRRLDEEKLYKHLVKRNWKRIADLNWENHFSALQYLQAIRDDVNGMLEMPFMEAVEILKCKEDGVPNYSRFLDPIGELNMLVQEAARTQRFGLL